MLPRDALSLLAAPGPFADDADRLMLYGQFVGAWDVDVTWYQADGGRRQGKGEWHFAWILGGRGVLDVLFASGAPAYQYGTTLRCYDKAMDAWHIAWMQPAGGEFVDLVGWQDGERIMQYGSGQDPRRSERWSFNEITPNSFLWLGEVSFDQGETWVLEQKMCATRRE